MYPRKPLLAVAALAAALVNIGFAAGPAAARTGDGVTIGYADLNIASAAGRATLDRRIATAARQVCGQYAPLELKMIALSRACRAETIAAARAQLVANPALASLRVSRAAI